MRIRPIIGRYRSGNVEVVKLFGLVIYSRLGENWIIPYLCESLVEVGSSPLREAELSSGKIHLIERRSGETREEFETRVGPTRLR